MLWGVYLSVPMNGAAIEFRKHAMLGSRGQWGQRLRALLAGAGVSPGTGVGVQLCVADPNYLDDLLYLALIFLLSHTTPSTNCQFEPFHLHRLTPDACLVRTLRESSSTAPQADKIADSVGVGQ